MRADGFFLFSRKPRIYKSHAYPNIFIVRVDTGLGRYVWSICRGHDGKPCSMGCVDEGSRFDRADFDTLKECVDTIAYLKNKGEL